MRETLYRAKRKDNREWIEGLPSYGPDGKITELERLKKIPGEDIPEIEYIEIDPETLCQYTRLSDKNGKGIFKGDIVKLILPDGEIRHFKVSIKNVVRKVLCHPDFDDEVSRVEITGIVFEWNGYELFPCIDTYGVPDYKMMEVIGNIFDNPEIVQKMTEGSD